MENITVDGKKYKKQINMQASYFSQGTYTVGQVYKYINAGDGFVKILNVQSIQDNSNEFKKIVGNDATDVQLKIDKIINRNNENAKYQSFTMTENVKGKLIDTNNNEVDNVNLDRVDVTCTIQDDIIWMPNGNNGGRKRRRTKSAKRKSSRRRRRSGRRHRKTRR